MGRKISLVALSAVLSLMVLRPAIAEDNGTFYVELVGPDEVVGEPEPQIYGPVRSNDTLWAIASLNRPSRSVSVYQMMYAILKKNPQAFNNGNIDSIINGSFLTLPVAAEVESVNHQMAVNALAPKPKPKPVKKTVVTNPTASSAVEKPVMAESVKVNAAALEQTEHNLDSLRDKLETRIDELEQLKRQEFDVLKQQMDESSQQMMGLAEVNHRMKMRIQELSDELAGIREELNENRKNQTQILQLLEKPKVDVLENQPETSWMSEFFSSPLNIGLVVFIPILLIALVITLVLRRKAKRELEEQDKEMAESTISLMDEEDEFSKLFSENLDPEDESSDEFASDFAEEPDLSVEDAALVADEDSDDLEPETEEASFEDFASTQQNLEDEIALDESEMSALDDFEMDDLVPDDTDAPLNTSEPEEDSDSIISADDLAAALALDDDEDLFDVAKSEPLDESEEISFEDALKQQQAMEAELSEVSDQDKIDLDNIDLSEDLVNDELTEQASTAAPEIQEESPEAEVGSEDEFETETETETPLATELESELVDFDLDDDQVDLADIELADPTIEDESDSNQFAEASQPEAPLDVDLANLELENNVVDIAAEPEVSAEQAMDADDDIDGMFADFGEDIFKQDAEPTDSELPSRSEIEAREFVDIDMLLNDADEQEGDDNDPYDKPSLDLELDSFPDVLPQDDKTDVDINAELASKLDLARAYLEIDDQDGAKKILQEVMVSDDQSLKKEAEDLLARFS
ncbi:MULTISPECIES: FimV/HubP family polar landmark protein [unclassified Agarivorans]|uniref:FimV/HubP family polar landmark protein n=1 Tax=unclassified Agarivorans TaxID=2636026 RepID=UPI003D7EEEA8